MNLAEGLQVFYVMAEPSRSVFGVVLDSAPIGTEENDKYSYINFIKA